MVRGVLTCGRLLNGTTLILTSALIITAITLFNVNWEDGSLAADLPTALDYNQADLTAAPVLNRTRVLCLVLTGPKNHKKKAVHVKKLWGRRCDKLLFMSTQNDTELGAVALDGVQEGRDWLWAKTKESLKYVWKHHRNDADWFLKADDDTYVVMENLKNFLSHYNASKPHYFGCRLQYKKGGPAVNFGGAGYVLSHEALRVFIEESLPDPKKCRAEHNGNEDTQLGLCLNNVGIHPSDTRDHLGRHRFMHSYPSMHLAWGKKWFYVMDRENNGFDCCADDIISFHHLRPDDLYVLEYMFYHFKLAKY